MQVGPPSPLRQISSALMTSTLTPLVTHALLGLGIARDHHRMARADGQNVAAHAVEFRAGHFDETDAAALRETGRVYTGISGK